MMTDRPAGAATAGLEDVASTEQFRRFLGWLAAVAFAFAATVVVGAVRYSNVRLAVTGTAVAAGVVTALSARRVVAAGHPRAAVKLLWGGLLVVATTASLCLPNVDAIPIGAGVIGAIVALPYLSGRQLRRLLILIFVWSAALTVGREAIPKNAAIPPSFAHQLEIGALLAFVGLALLLLRHFRDRLTTLLAKTREAEVRYRTLVDQLPAMTYLDEITGPGDDDIRPLYMSPQAETMLGYPIDEWMARPDLWSEILHPEDRDRVVEEGRRADAEGRQFSSEYRAVAKDGRVVWLREESVRILDENGNPRYWQGVLFDITNRKEVEEELRRSFEFLRRTDEERRKLLRELVSSQEEERKRLAAEIHDDPVQKMTAVGLRLQMLRGKLSEPAQLELLDQLRATVEIAIARMRSMMFELRPPSLDRSGLADALRDYISCVDGQLGECRVDDELTTRLSEATRAIAYRIAVEALSNVQRHAHADHVQVLLAERERGLFMRIRDDGAGIPAKVLANGKPGHLGLTSLRERAEMAGGWSRIESRGGGGTGGGTTVEIWLPMALAASSSADG